MKQRKNPDLFEIPIETIKSGFYSDSYFLKTRDILNKDNHHPKVLMQVFQRQQAILCGIDEAIAVIKKCAYHPENLKITALYDGDVISPWETIMTIEGDLADFSHLETVYLGILARQSKIATNVKEVVTAAGSKPVLFFPARYDDYRVQVVDGYAAKIGGAIGVSTPANAFVWNTDALGTIPHALIAAYGGDTTKATNAFDKYIDSNVSRVALVDFDNDCVETSLTIARILKDKLYAVRLDTSESLIDKSVMPFMGEEKSTGVCKRLVLNVRKALDDAGFGDVKIMVSGGFTAKKISEFEAANIPIDCYAVGSHLFEGNVNFTADIVMVDEKPCAKVGRSYRPNHRLQLV